MTQVGPYGPVHRHQPNQHVADTTRPTMTAVQIVFFLKGINKDTDGQSRTCGLSHHGTILTNSLFMDHEACCARDIGRIGGSSRAEKGGLFDSSE